LTHLECYTKLMWQKTPFTCICKRSFFIALMRWLSLSTSRTSNILIRLCCLSCRMCRYCLIFTCNCCRICRICRFLMSNWCQLMYFSYYWTRWWIIFLKNIQLIIFICILT